MTTPLGLTVDRFVGSKAVLKTSDGQTLTVATRSLPANTQEGDVLNVEFFRNQDATLRQENIARQLLQELLHGHEKKPTAHHKTVS